MNIKLLGEYIYDNLLYLMQFSILVPMAVVWWRRRHFSAPVRMLSWYVYLSAISAIGSRVAAYYFHNNLLVLAGFNTGKILLLAAVYAQVLVLAQMRRALLVATGVALVIILSTVTYDWTLTVAVSRVLQCALLAAFALVYLEQQLRSPVGSHFSRDTIWLLSIGQLLYSAGTVSGFSLEIMGNHHFQVVEFIFVALSGLLFNYFLTLAFWRAERHQPTATEPEPAIAAELVGS